MKKLNEKLRNISVDRVDFAQIFGIKHNNIAYNFRKGKDLNINHLTNIVSKDKKRTIYTVVVEDDNVDLINQINESNDKFIEDVKNIYIKVDNKKVQKKTKTKTKVNEDKEKLDDNNIKVDVPKIDLSNLEIPSDKITMDEINIQE